MSTLTYDDPNECVSSIINKLGHEIIIAAPLGLGKPIQLLNAFYKYAKQNPNIQLKILTALSLIKPTISNELAWRFAGPLLEKLYHDYIDLEYEVDRRAQRLPKNVQVIEFYFEPGKYLNNNTAQQDYICSNYTHVIRDLLCYKVNVIVQLLSSKNKHTGKYSLSCNADLTLDLIDAAEKSKNILKKPILIGEINSRLPYMYGNSAEASEEMFYSLVDNKNSSQLFQIPRPAISEHDFMIGLYSSTLIKDNGCLQIGIGSLSEALVANIILRHKNNREYINLINKTKINEKFASIIKDVGSTSPFKTGLFASTEMLVDGFIDLYKNNILTKKVYDDVFLQKMLNENLITEEVTPNIIELLLTHKRISIKLTKDDFDYLQYFGIFKNTKYMRYHEGYIYFSLKEKIYADFDNVKSKKIIINQCLGEKLKNGRIVHAGFYIGSQALYDYLMNLSIKERKNFEMRGITQINQLYNSEELDKLQRINARFVNSTMKVTLLGSVVSDSLQNAKVISGVGGQYNFIAMAHELAGARSIINCKSTYIKKGKVESNIVWQYGATTIPRHLRDIVVTEYGIADCRSKTDSEVIKALLNVADSRFQDQLLAVAKKYGKLPRNYQIPEQYKYNFPETILQYLNFNHINAVYQRYPFSTSLSEEEVKLEKTLHYLNSLSIRQKLLLLLKGVFISSKPYEKLLIRMKLAKPNSIKEYIYSFLLMGAFNNLYNDLDK